MECCLARGGRILFWNSWPKGFKMSLGVYRVGSLEGIFWGAFWVVASNLGWCVRMVGWFACPGGERFGRWSCRLAPSGRRLGGVWEGTSVLRCLMF